jgi:uncharacterized protein YlxW (UPF0749 family)
MNKSMYVSIGLVSMILGIMLAFQFRTTRYVEQSVPADRAQELLMELSKLEKENRKLDEEINDLSYKLEQAEKGQQQARAAIQDELQKARVSAGLLAVSGPGIEVVLENPPNHIGRGGISIIRDEDLLGLANELRGAGAEAISINGKRLISTSEIRQAGNFININLDRTEPPFHILAIGDPDKLMSSLTISEGLEDYLKDLGIVVKVQPYDNLTIPGYNKFLQFEYVKSERRG